MRQLPVMRLKNFLAISLCLLGIITHVWGLDAQTTLAIQNAVETEYRKAYPSISFKKVSITLATNESTDSFSFTGLDFQRQNLSRNSGTFLGTFEDTQGAKRRFFVRYDIDATIDVVRTKITIPKDKTIDIGDIQPESVPFKVFYASPITQEQAVGLAATRYIPSGTILTKRDAQKAPLVRKNDPLTATISQDPLDIEFSVTAVQDGDENDTINVKAKNNKILKAVIVSKDRVLIQ